MSYRKHLMTSDMPPSELYKATELGTNLAEVGTDLISRQAAIDYFVINVGFHDEDGYPIEDTDELRKIWTEYFDGIPSAEPEIVRCKDCKHWREGTAFSYCDKLYGMGVLDALDYMVAEDDYCSMAERRTDE